MARLVLASLLIPAAVIAAGSPARAERDPPLVDEVSYYEIRGKSEKALRDAIDRQGPLDRDGERYGAETKWNVRWKYEYGESDDGRCRLDSLVTDVTVTTTLPKWVDRDTAARPLGERWDRYMAALILHESGHKKIGTGAALAIRERVRKVPAQASCPAVKTAVDAAANAILEEFRSREADYDRTTDHGATQGATFP